MKLTKINRKNVRKLWNLERKLRLKSLAIEEGVRVIIRKHTPKLKEVLEFQQTKEPYKFQPSQMGGTGGSKFLGLPFPLLPDISTSQVAVGGDNPVLKTYGINQRKDTCVTLFKGPNRKANRYLKWQYIRMLRSIGATLNPGQDGELQVKTDFDMDVVKRLGKTFDEHDREIPPHIFWTLKLRELANQELSRSDRKALNKRTNTYWMIAMDMLVNSKALRLALMNKTLSKHGWLHRGYSVEKLAKFNKEYVEIVRQFKQYLPVRRCWIPQGDASWRPLGISPVAWRIYTRGLANFMEVFLKNCWPKNQHGYTTKRGVHTAWSYILKDVVKSKNIYEFDFVGFFNNVKLTSVGTNLQKCSVPKWMTGHFVNLISGDVENIKPKKLEQLVASKTWVPLWKKHEYIHKYRKGWRDRGLAQGSTISPLLSVLPLIVLEELQTKGIEYVSFADDGALHGNTEGDYGVIMQELLDSNGVGATVHKDKSKWVKKDGIWLSKLKFVGLIYDPWANKLSACTRGGATLDLSIQTAALIDRTLPFLSPWEDKRNHTPILDFNSETVKDKLQAKLLDSFVWLKLATELSKMASLVLNYPKVSIVWLASMYMVGVIPHAMALGLLYHFSKFITPFMEVKKSLEGISSQLMYWNLDKLKLGYLGTEVEKATLQLAFQMEFEERTGTVQEWIPGQDWLRNMQSPHLWYWYLASKKLDSDKAFELMNTWLPTEAILEMESVISSWKPSDGEIIASDAKELKVTEDNIRAMIWYKNIVLPPKLLEKVNIKELNKRIGDFKVVGSLPTDILDQLPEDMKHIQDWSLKKGFEATLAISELGWESVVKTKYLGTFIARLFVNSFKNEGVVQDFHLKYEERSLIDNIKKVIGPKYVEEALGISLNVFNSSSISMAYALKMMELWDKKLGRINVLDYWKSIYISIYKKIGNRRTGWSTKGKCEDHQIYGEWEGCWNLNRDLSTKRLKDHPDFLSPEEPYEADGKTFYQSFDEEQLPLVPYSNLDPPGKAYKKAVHRKLQELIAKGMKWETIINSITPEFKVGTEPSNFYNKRPKGTDWYTWAPYLKGKRKGKVGTALGKKAVVPIEIPLARSVVKFTKYFY